MLYFSLYFFVSSIWFTPKFIIEPINFYLPIIGRFCFLYLCDLLCFLSQHYSRVLRQYRIIIVVQMCHEIFRQIAKSEEGILTYFNELLAKMTGNLGADARQRR